MPCTETTSAEAITGFSGKGGITHLGKDECAASTDKKTQ